MGVMKSFSKLFKKTMIALDYLIYDPQGVWLRLAIVTMISLFLYVEIFSNNIVYIYGNEARFDLGFETIYLVSVPNITLPEVKLPEYFDINNVPGAIYTYAYANGGFKEVCFKNDGTYIRYDGKIDFDNVRTMITHNNKFTFIKNNDVFCKSWEIFRGSPMIFKSIFPASNLRALARSELRAIH